MVAGVSEKRCVCCGEVKPLEAFHRRSKCRDGRRGRCKECRKPPPRVFVQQHSVIGAVMGKECRQCGEWKPLGEYHKHRCNIDGLAYACKACARERARVWGKEHTGHVVRRVTRWRKEHPLEYRKQAVAHTRRTRARKDGAEGRGVTVSDWRLLLEKYGSECLACGEKRGLEMDHIVPISRGGAHDPQNIQPLCRPCNASKNARYIDFRPEAFWADWT